MLPHRERRIYRLDLIVIATATCCATRHRCWAGCSCCGKNGGLGDCGTRDGSQWFGSPGGTDADVLPGDEIGAIAPDRGVPRNELLKSRRGLCRDGVTGVAVFNHICGASGWNAQFLFFRQSRDLDVCKRIDIPRQLANWYNHGRGC